MNTCALGRERLPVLRGPLGRSFSPKRRLKRIALEQISHRTSESWELTVQRIQLGKLYAGQNVTSSRIEIRNADGPNKI